MLQLRRIAIIWIKMKCLIVNWLIYNLINSELQWKRNFWIFLMKRKENNLSMLKLIIVKERWNAKLLINLAVKKFKKEKIKMNQIHLQHQEKMNIKMQKVLINLINLQKVLTNQIKLSILKQLIFCIQDLKNFNLE